MLTDLQTKKLTRAFHVWDADHNGLVEESDFDSIVNNLASIRTWPAGSAERQELHTRYFEQWHVLKTLADPGSSGVTLAQWLAFLDVQLGVTEKYAQLEGLVDFVWNVLDGNRDGKVTREELSAFYKAYRLSPELADDLLRRAGKKEGESLDRAEIQALVRDFYFSDDAHAAGGFLYGAF